MPKGDLQIKVVFKIEPGSVSPAQAHAWAELWRRLLAPRPDAVEQAGQDRGAKR